MYNISIFTLLSNDQETYKVREEKRIKLVEKIGEGSNSFVYKLDNDHVIKIYKNSIAGSTQLIESDSICIPELIKPIMANWLSGNISDGFLLDAFQKYVDVKLVNIPFEINENNVYDVEVPEWVKNIGYWWLEGAISDDDFSNAMNNLLERNIIGFPAKMENGI